MRRGAPVGNLLRLLCGPVRFARGLPFLLSAARAADRAATAEGENAMNALTRTARCLHSCKRTGLALAAGLALAGTATAQVSEEARAAWVKAEVAYETQHYAEALALYEALALQGDAQAARLAGEMLLLAPALNDKNVTYDPARAARWLKQAASAGSASAQFLVRRIEARGLAEPESAAPAPAPYVPGPFGC
jgi:TPR repeat protein